MSRTPDVIKYEKIREVYKFMLNVSKRPKEIVQFFTNKWTEEDFFKEGIGDLAKQRTIYNYIKKVKISFMNFENDVATEKGRQLARLDDLYQKNIKIEDYKAAKDIIKEINIMLGLNAATKTDITTKGESINNYKDLTIEELINKNDSISKDIDRSD